MSGSGETEFSRAYRTAKNNWATHHNNLGLAYDNALANYHKTLKAQKEADRAAAERSAQFVMLALSLAGGSLLGALFGKTALKSVAGEFVKNAALEKIVKNNMDNAFRALAWTDNNAAAKFVLGKLWDESAKKISSEFESKLKIASESAKIVGGQQGEIQSTLAFITPMKNFINNLANAVVSAEAWISSSGGGEKQIEQLIKFSPFFRKPPPVLVNKVETDIELSFWMKYILDQDYLEKGHARYLIHGDMIVADEYVNIPQSPRSPNYPKDSYHVANFERKYSKVKYRDSGDIIGSRIKNVLIKSKIYPGISLLYDFSSNSKSNLLLAETILKMLAAQNATNLRAAKPK